MPFPALTIVRIISNNRNYSPDPNSPLDFSDKNYMTFLHFQVGVQGRLEFTSDLYLHFKSTSDLVDIIKINTRQSRIPFDIYSATWNENRKLEYTEVLTTQLFGRAFNLIEDFKLLNIKK